MLQSFQGETRKIQNCVPIADSRELDTEQGIKRWVHTPKCASVIYRTNFDNLSRKNDKNRPSCVASTFSFKAVDNWRKSSFAQLRQLLIDRDGKWLVYRSEEKGRGGAPSYFCVLESQSREIVRKTLHQADFPVDIFSFSMEMTPLMKGEGLSYQKEETAPDFEKELSWASSRSELRFRVTEYYWDRW